MRQSLPNIHGRSSLVHNEVDRLHADHYIAYFSLVSSQERPIQRSPCLIGIQLYTFKRHTALRAPMPTFKVERVGKREIREDSAISNAPQPSDPRVAGELRQRSRSRARKKRADGVLQAPIPSALKIELGLPSHGEHTQTRAVSPIGHVKKETKSTSPGPITKLHATHSEHVETQQLDTQVKEEKAHELVLFEVSPQQSSAEIATAGSRKKNGIDSRAVTYWKHSVNPPKVHKAVVRPLTSLYLGILLTLATVSYYLVVEAWSSGLLHLDRFTPAASARVSRPQAISYVALAKSGVDSVEDVCHSCILQSDLQECLYTLRVMTDKEDALWSALLDHLDPELATLKAYIARANATQTQQQVQRARSHLAQDRRQVLTELRSMYDGPESCVARVLSATKRGIVEYGNRAWAQRFTWAKKSIAPSAGLQSLASLSPSQMMMWRNQTTCLSQLQRASSLGQAGADRIDQQIKLEVDAAELLLGMEADLEYMTVLGDRDKNTFLSRTFVVVQTLYRSHAGNSTEIVGHWQSM
ncbi:hypothetical protein EDD37DRAFT_371366 [Exophiala viscosa]|uniref:uncharacterized protein n=1 Tax=Exophiala viscosa TaxID=2486360 RepID=UPI0021A10DAD|nr:hypothetical protein EDD37DRAFT_371366 [Exophiala viscosa]